MIIVATKDSLKPSGHYSQGIIYNDTIYVSAQLPINPLTGEKKCGSIDEETDRILENIEIILNEAGSGKDNIIKTTVYLTDISLWDNVNKRYDNFFQNHKPARTIVSVKEIHLGFKVAIEAIAGKQPFENMVKRQKFDFIELPPRHQQVFTTSFLNEVQRRRDFEKLKALNNEDYAEIVDTTYASLKNEIILSPWIEGNLVK